MNYSPMNRPKDYFHLLFINMTIILNKITSANENHFFVGTNSHKDCQNKFCSDEITNGRTQERF